MATALPLLMLGWEMGNPISGAPAVPSSLAHPVYRCPARLDGQVSSSGWSEPGAQASCGPQRTLPVWHWALRDRRAHVLPCGAAGAGTCCLHSLLLASGRGAWLSGTRCFPAHLLVGSLLPPRDPHSREVCGLRDLRSPGFSSPIWKEDVNHTWLIPGTQESWLWLCILLGPLFQAMRKHRGGHLGLTLV